MIKTIRTCDICGKEVEDLPGTLQLKYSDSDCLGYGYPAGVKYEDICIDCCRKLEKVIRVITDLEKENAKLRSIVASYKARKEAKK